MGILGQIVVAFGVAIRAVAREPLAVMGVVAMLVSVAILVTGVLLFLIFVSWSPFLIP